MNELFGYMPFILTAPEPHPLADWLPPVKGAAGPRKMVGEKSRRARRAKGRAASKQRRKNRKAG